MILSYSVGIHFQGLCTVAVEGLAVARIDPSIVQL